MEEFEDVRSVQRRTSPLQLQLRRDIRELLLLEWGVSNHEIAQAVRANVKAKHHRRRTVASIGTYDVIEEMIEKTARKIKRSLHVGKKSSKPNTDQRMTEIERLTKSSSESEMSRSAIMTLNNLAIDFPYVFSTSTNTASGDSVDVVETVAKKTTSGNTKPCDTSSVTVNEYKTPPAVFDRAPIIPRRPSSPVSSCSTNGVATTRDYVAAALDLSSQIATMNDPDFNVQMSMPTLEMSDSALDDFDTSITTRDTRDDGILTLSFGKDTFFDESVCAQVNQAKEICIQTDLSIEDEESTINTSDVKAIVQAIGICSTIIEATGIDKTSACQINDTKNAINSLTIAMRKSALEHSLIHQHGTMDVEHDDDDETSINSQLIQLLYGSEEILVQLDQSDGTWPETNRIIESSKNQEVTLPSTTSINHITEKYCSSVAMETAETHETIECIDFRYSTTSSAVNTSCNSTTNTSQDVERSSECGTTTTTSTTITNAIDNTQTIHTTNNNNMDGDGVGTLSANEANQKSSHQQRQRRRRYVARPLSEVTELIEL